MDRCVQVYLMLLTAFKNAARSIIALPDAGAGLPLSALFQFSVGLSRLSLSLAHVSGT